MNYREPTPGMGEGVVRRTYARTLPSGGTETWGDIADRVALGNILLDARYGLHAPVLDEATGATTHVGYTLNTTGQQEYDRLRDHIAQARVLTSGRHLQQGDAFQPYRNMEVFTNCATAATSFALFYLLLNGAGVGRDYTDDLMVVDWDKLPTVVPVLGNVPTDYAGKYLQPGHRHPEREKAVEKGFHDRYSAIAAYEGHDIIVFDVPDSREGWAKAVELMERMAFEGTHAHKVLVLDFSAVRPVSAPIGGMQNRPASGPIPLMEAIANVAAVKGKAWAPWKQTMYVDHYLADCVQVGGARRAARMSVKLWTDKDAAEFAHIKNTGGLWSSNNSLGVDAEFWRKAESGSRKLAASDGSVLTVKEKQAHALFTSAISAAYQNGTGEPGYINLDKLHFDPTGIDVFDDGDIMGSSRYQLDAGTLALTKALVRRWKGMTYKVIVNPCAEIPLISLGAFCVIGDVVPYFAASDEEAIDAFKVMARALVRVNTMENFYAKEVRRTNRIGVGITAFHEWAWSRFKFTWRDLINENASRPFWELVQRCAKETLADLTIYCAELALVMPHTVFTGKPSGTVSKPFHLTEGFHLPAFAYYLRGVQFDRMASAEQIAEYRAKGYPVIENVKDRPSVVVVQFPTQLTIGALGIPLKEMVYAFEASMPEQYAYLGLIEKWWLGERGNQISYTLKYDPTVVSEAEFRANILAFQPLVRCCSVMPAKDAPAALQASLDRYGYLPEYPITKAEYDGYTSYIAFMEEEFDPTSFACDSGACPLI